MKVYTKCDKCKTDISFSTWATDRVVLKMSKGNSVRLTCKKCDYSENYLIDGLKAKESKIALLIALLVFLVGTPILFVLLWDLLFRTNNIYTIFGLFGTLIIPSTIFSIISKNDRLRVNSFNRS